MNKLGNFVTWEMFSFQTVFGLPSLHLLWIWLNILLEWIYIFLSGGQYIPDVIQVFSSKIISHLLYTVAIWISITLGSTNHPLSWRLCWIMGIPRCVSDMFLSWTGLGARAWLSAFMLRIKTVFVVEADGLLFSLKQHAYYSVWMMIVDTKL